MTSQAYIYTSDVTEVSSLLVDNSRHAILIPLFLLVILVRLKGSLRVREFLTHGNHHLPVAPWIPMCRSRPCRPRIFVGTLFGKPL